MSIVSFGHEEKNLNRVTSNSSSIQGVVSMLNKDQPVAKSNTLNLNLISADNLQARQKQKRSTSVCINLSQEKEKEEFK